MTNLQKKYIFYLHPADGSALCDRLYEYWEKQTMVCGRFGERKRNEALKYPFHVTLTSFFRMEDDEKMERLIEIAKDAFKDVPASPVTECQPYSLPNAHINAGPRSNDNMAGLSVTAPAVSQGISKLVENGAAFGLKSGTINSLHMTLYHMVTYETMELLEVGMADVIRATAWQQARIVLWETDDAYTKWTPVHNFSVQADGSRAAPSPRVEGLLLNGTKDDILGALPVGYDAAHLAEFQAVFKNMCQVSNSGDFLTGVSRAFIDFLIEHGVPVVNLPSFFRLFDRKDRGHIDEEDFVVGLVAADPNTVHSGDWGVYRLQRLFSLYAGSLDGALDFGNFKLMVRHILLAKGTKDVNEASVSECAIEAAKDFTIEEQSQILRLGDFIKGVREMKFRGTHSLFRFSVSPLTKIKPRRSSGAPLESVQIQQRVIQYDRVGNNLGSIPLRDFEPSNDALRKIQYGFNSAILETPPSENVGVSIAMRVMEAYLLSKWQAPSGQSEYLFTLVTVDEIEQLCLSAIDYLNEEPTCVDIKAPARVFGDIHGTFPDLLELFSVYGSPNHRTGQVNLVKYVFVGDFVDRGRFSLEVVVLLVSLKVLYPKNIILIRGNHEVRSVNFLYGFYEECRERMRPSGSVSKAGDGPGQRVWELFNNFFDYLPLAACIGDVILCMHGGIGGSVQSIDQINALKRPLYNAFEALESPEARQLVIDILWSDPTANDAVMGLHANARGINILMFGPDRVEKFCTENRLQLLIRAHECVCEGYQWFAGGRLVTVFSAPNYTGELQNNAALLEISPELKVTPKILKARTKESVLYIWRPQQRPGSPLPPK